jgi:histidyl-tRNA synthetase
MMQDYLCDDCRDHFTKVQQCLTNAGVDFTVNPMIVRGLDYYTRTVFEFISNDLGAQSTVCGGGRYDGLVSEMGGAPTPALGYAIGLERLLMILEAQKIELPPAPKCELYIASLGAEAEEKAFSLATIARECSIFAACDICGRSLKAQMKYANKIGTQYTIVIGEEEIAQNCAKLKNMETGETTDISLGEKFIEDFVARATQDEDLGNVLFDLEGFPEDNGSIEL